MGAFEILGRSSPSCRAKGWIIQDGGVECNETFADAIFDIVQVARA